MTQPNLTRGDELTSAQLRQLADKFDTDRDGVWSEDLDQAAGAMRAFAALKDRAAAGVTDAMVLRASKVYLDSLNIYGATPRDTAMRAALTAILPDVAGERELADWRELFAAFSLSPINGPAALWPNNWHQDAALVAFALHKQNATGGCNGLDTPERVRFYEHDFYVLSNFSAFKLVWKGFLFHTSEAAYQREKFPDDMKNLGLRTSIQTAASAHEAFKIAEKNKDHRRPDWDAVKVDVMREILRAKVDQHEYVRRKLLATGNRELVEDSWRDDFWGWGPNRDGQNMLGKLWMEIRAELLARPSGADGEGK